MARRVVITGLGVIASNGIGKDNFWKACVEGKSGIDTIKSFDISEYNTKIAGEVKGFDPTEYMNLKTANSVDRFAQFGIAAAKMAVEDAGINIDKENKNAIGTCIGAGLGGMFFYEKQIVAAYERKTIKRADPRCVPTITPNAASGQISIYFGLLGPNITISTACSSGNHALGLATDMIKQERANIIFAGGTEAPIIPLTFAAFNALRVMSRKYNDTPQTASRPFDKTRDGFVMGEGAAVLILEELNHAKRRRANIYAEIVGYGSTSGGFHMVMPAPQGKDAARAVKLALETARLSPNKIDYINAHGTSTQANDKTETQALKEIFKSQAYKIPISSTKSMIGHPIGASAAIEAIVCCLALRNNIIPPTINYKIPDPDCDLDYVPNEARKKKLRVVLSNSFGFGSNNASIVLRKI